MDSAINSTGAAASWQADPFGRHEQRWWDGDRWTEKVRSTGTTGIDPPGIVAKPEHARDHVPAQPITDATNPVDYRSHALPRMLLLSLLVLITIVVIVIVGIATA
jgi:hypothetical protein